MKKKLSLTSKIFLGLILGGIFGILLQNFGHILNNDIILFSGHLAINFMLIINGVLKIIGDSFLNCFKMLIVPLVFTSLACGSSSLGDIRKIGRIGGKTILFYLFTTAAAITISIVLALAINPGNGLDMSHIVTQEPTIVESKSFVDTIISMIPTNPFESMVKGDMLQVIVFSLLLGIAISLVGEKAEPFKNVLESFNSICMKIIDLIMELVPYGVFALISSTFAKTGFDAMLPLLKYMSVILLGLLVQGTLVYSGLLKAFTGLKLKPFYKRFSKVAAVTFSTSSSSASLPVTTDAMIDAGVSNSIGSFTLPLGTTINMDGTAIMQGTAAIFISQVYGIDLGISGILTIILTATLASIGTAGVPGVGMVMLSMVLQSVGLPVEGIALILGVDRILDMCRTTINVMGDCVCTLIVSKSEKEFDETKYYSVD